MTIEDIIRWLSNPATIMEALREAEKIQFSDWDRTVFEMNRDKFHIGMSDYDKVNCIEELKGLISKYETNNNEDLKLWHHLDKQNLKERFKKLRRDQNLLKVIFIEYDEEALSSEIHDILFSDYKYYYSSDVTKFKGDIKGDTIHYKLDLSKIDDIEDDWTEFVGGVFELSGNLVEIKEKFTKENKHKENNFIVQFINNFNVDNFEVYYSLWDSLTLEKPLFLCFHVKENVLPATPARSNYLFCHSCIKDMVDHYEFRCFFSTYKKWYNEDATLCQNSCPPMSYRDAVEKLKFCQK
jgi:hypothetical protein